MITKGQLKFAIWYDSIIDTLIKLWSWQKVEM